MSSTKFKDTNFSVYEGDTEHFQFRAVKDDTAFDLTGYTISMVIKRTREDISPVLSVAQDDTISDLDAGLVGFTLTAAQTAVLNGAYVYDAQVTLGGVSYTIATGNLFVRSNVA